LDINKHGCTAGNLNFTLKEGVSGRFLVRLVLIDNGRDESIDHNTNGKGAVSEERIIAIQADAENLPPTFSAVQNITLMQSQVT
jgi:hypothetical protein